MGYELGNGTELILLLPKSFSVIEFRFELSVFIFPTFCLFREEEKKFIVFPTLNIYFIHSRDFIKLNI